MILARNEDEYDRMVEERRGSLPATPAPQPDPIGQEDPEEPEPDLSHVPDDILAIAANLTDAQREVLKEIAQHGNEGVAWVFGAQPSTYAVLTRLGLIEQRPFWTDQSFHRTMIHHAEQLGRLIDQRQYDKAKEHGYRIWSMHRDRQHRYVTAKGKAVLGVVG
jgi:predicted GNAT superfamily acetyltransferase